MDFFQTGSVNSALPFIWFASKIFSLVSYSTFIIQLSSRNRVTDISRSVSALIPKFIERPTHLFSLPFDPVKITSSPEIVSLTTMCIFRFLSLVLIGLMVSKVYTNQSWGQDSVSIARRYRWVTGSVAFFQWLKDCVPAVVECDNLGTRYSYGYLKFGERTL